MRTRSILLVAGVLTMSLAPIISEQAFASVQIYDFSTIAGLATHSGGTDGTNSAARFHDPAGVAVDTNGNVYVADEYNHIIRKVTLVGTNWVTTTIAGLATHSGTNDGANSDARFYGPSGIAVDTNDNVYVADDNNHTIRKVTLVGTDWVTTTIAGLATHSGTNDGANSDARFYFPMGVAVDTNGNVYVADEVNHTIRKVTLVGTNWVTTTIAGSAGNPGSVDGTNGTARFNSPAGVAADSGGNLYVADEYNHIIRKVTPVGPNWVTTTIGGLALNPGSTDGTNSTALFNSPYGVTVDANGKLYVADTYNDTIRLGVPWGTLTINKETAKLNFAKTNACSCTLTATLDLDATYDLTNKLVSLDIGGADASFTLDAKGKGHGAGTNGTSGTCKLSYKKKTGPWTFTAKLKNGPWITPWAAYGLSNTTTTVKAGVPVTLPVTLVIGDDGFIGEKALLYKAKTGKSGNAK